MTTKKSQKPVDLSPELQKELERALSRTWDVIAWDCLAAAGDGDAEAATMTREEVVDVTLDQLENGHVKLSPALLAFLRVAPFAQLQDLARGVFRFAKYGA